MKLALIKSRPMLICRDVQAMIQFYVKTLGFRIEDRMDDVGLSGWAAISRDQFEIMLASPSYIPAPPMDETPLNQVILYVEVTALSKLREEIVETEHPIGPTETRFYGHREFEILDPEGHRIIFAEKIRSQ
ncbi:MAG: hypothetical protein F4Z01_09600 [Gammaproteobacteria bacterium]|nr:hypothetical protein [Gammaproteobacteria bacterium]MYF38423.1 hypothetical protein [Gammaproteobacteria bacterium]